MLKFSTVVRIFRALLLGVTLPAAAAPLELRLTIETDRPFVACEFNGQSTRRGCVLDTGSSATALPSDLIETVAPIEVAARTQVFATGSSAPCEWIKIESVRLSQAPADLAHVLRCPRLESGLVGVDLLDQKILRFDFRRGLVNELDAYPSRAPRWPLRRSANGHIYIPMLIGQERVWAMWDTGIRNYGMIDESYYWKHTEMFEYVKSVTTIDATGSRKKSRVYRLKRVGFVGGRGNSVEFTVEDFSKLPWLRQDQITMVLGYGGIRWYQWIFDLKNNQWGLVGDESDR